MEDEAESLSQVIGARVRLHRQRRGWTLDQVADAAGVSRRVVVNIEQGATNPSIGTLLRLSDALGVGLPSLVEPPERKPSQVTRSGAGAVLWTGQHGGQGVLLSATPAPDVVELWSWSLGPRERHNSEAHSTGTKELLHVQHGSITVGVEDELFELATGDALSFPGDVAHSYANPASTPARFSLAVWEPGVGTRLRADRSDD